MNREEKMVRQTELMFRDYPDVVTPQEVQKMLGVGRRKVYELLQSGELFSVRIGKLYRVPKHSVAQYICGFGGCKD